MECIEHMNKAYKVMRKLLGVIIISFCAIATDAQTLSSKDLKLLLDGKSFEDSTITVGELLKVKEVTANFAWLSFKRITIYSTSRGFSETRIAPCPDNKICAEARELIKRLRPGDTIVFEAEEPKNRSGVPVKIQGLVFHVK